MSDPWAAYPSLEAGGAATAPPKDPWENFPALNVPTGELSQGPADRPRGYGGVVDDPERGASLATIARASLAPDVQDQMRRYAAARFPGLPVDEAVKRYGIDRDGNIIFADPVSGQLVREVPTVGRGEGLGDKFMRLGHQAASGAGSFIPATAAGVVGAMTAPTGGSILAAGAAAGAADLARQAADRALAGEDWTNLSYRNAAGHAVMNAAGQAVGVGINKLRQRNPLGVAPHDRVQAMSPAEQQRWRELYAEAKRRGVDLTVGETTDLRSLAQLERYLRRHDDTADMTNKFLRQRNNEQIPAAINAELDRIAPPRHAAVGANMMRQGAEDVVSGMVKKRTAAASPHYQAAFASGVEPDISPVLQEIEARLAKVGEATPAGRGLRAMLNALTQEERVVDATGKEVTRRVPLRNYEVLHSVKEQFDDIVSGAFDANQTSAAKRAARDFAGIKAELADVLKSAHPGYAQGASIYSQMSVPINEAREGAISILLDKDPSSALQYAERLLNPGNGIPPHEITKIRQLYTAAGKQDEWMAGVRSYLANRLDIAEKLNATATSGSVGGKFVASVWGKDSQRNVLRAAIGDQQLATSFEKLTDVLRAAARSLPEGSPTSTDTMIDKSMGRPSAVAKTIGAIFSPGKWLNLGDEVVEGVTALRRPAQRIALAEHLMSPSGMAQLRRMTMLSPTSQKAIDIASLILTDAGIIVAGQAMNPPKPQMPEQAGPLP